MDEIKVTLESLYDILRNEKKKEDLQKLSPTFFIDVVHYLRDKKMLLDGQGSSDDLFAANEKEKLEYELRSIKRILKEIYEKREKKIIDIALNKSRTRSDIIDTSAMLREEKIFYNHILGQFDSFRMNVLLKLFHGQFPNIDEISANASVNNPIPTPAVDPFSRFEGDEEEDTANETPDYSAVDSKLVDVPTLNQSKIDASTEVKPIATTPNPASTTTPTSASTTITTPVTPSLTSSETVAQITSTESTMSKIKIIHPVPRFIWKDMKEYGPFGKDEETEIFPEVANLLVRKGRAEML